MAHPEIDIQVGQIIHDLAAGNYTSWDRRVVGFDEKEVECEWANPAPNALSPRELLVIKRNLIGCRFVVVDAA